jgi:hypothetical protein
MSDVELSEHAKDMFQERNIAEEWVFRAYTPVALV